MNSVQRLEVKRLTPTMWTALEYAARLDGHAEIGGPSWMRSANILARRGFCILHRLPDGYCRITLTDAGREALAVRGKLDAMIEG